MAYRKAAFLVVLAAGALSAGVAQGQIRPSGNESTSANQSDLIFDAIELEKMTVTGERLEPEEELAMRMVSWALDVDRSFSQEDAWKPRCWFEEGPGSHLIYLYCATNAALNDIRAESQAMLSAMAPAGTSAVVPGARSASDIKLHRSQYPINPLQLKELLKNFGTKAVNEEIVKRALADDVIPKEIPYQAELDQFIDALAEVQKLSAAYDSKIQQAKGKQRDDLIAESDARMVTAIESAGLTVERYNEISSLVEKYGSLRAQVQKRLASR